MADVEHFISRWSAREGGQERANYALFLAELCAVIGVPPPEPAGHASELNAYVFERAVTFREPDGSTAKGRIDLYKRGCFVLEAKQSRQGEGPKAAGAVQQGLFAPEELPQGRRESRRWDVLMMNARRQAEDYAKALPPAEGWPPFLIVCDVGHCLELYADFSGQGKNYAQFPDRQGFRIFLTDLRSEEVRARLRLIWTDPHSLDPTKRAAKVTRDIAERLARVSKFLEEQRGPDATPRYQREAIAAFLMRCLFTMFAEDVELIPKESFKGVLERCRAKPELFPALVGQLWEAMDKGEFAYAIEAKVKRFNGYLFKDRTVLPLPCEEIGELYEAARANWREVEPAIFGTLLEQALDPAERRKLGAHYTPRAYVERLVIATLIEPLREEWDHVRATAERLSAAGNPGGALGEVSKFHARLCEVRVLDPACGTGNFLYVALELMKRLEGEVLEAVADLGGQEALGLDRHTIDPHQFLGMELNPHAAAIAELVVWIGFLQWFFRTQGGQPTEPILRDFQTIRSGDAVLAWDAMLPLFTSTGSRAVRWDGISTKRHPVTRQEVPDLDKTVELFRYTNPRPAPWPPADFIIGNPPFIGLRNSRKSYSDEYLEALRAAYPHIPENVDYVMYWWDRCAALVRSKSDTLADAPKRFGLITSNSITQTFNVSVVSAHLNDASQPLSLVYAIPDHPWVDNATGAAIRIAMTVGQAGIRDGILLTIDQETPHSDESEGSSVSFRQSRGMIYPDLKLGIDVLSAGPLASNDGVASVGYQLTGKGFLLSPEHTREVLIREPISSNLIHSWVGGIAIQRGAPPKNAIDVCHLSEESLRSKHPTVFQHLRDTVYPERVANARAAVRDRWWIYGEPRNTFRPALTGIDRIIVTSLTASHRVFVFCDSSVVADSTTVMFALPLGEHLALLSSRHHVVWSLNVGGRMGVGNDPRYNKSRCFDPFPFPNLTEEIACKLRNLGEQLDEHRKSVIRRFSDISITKIYNVLSKIESESVLSEKERDIYERALVSVLADAHQRIDELVSDAYGWPRDLADEEIIARLVALNKERAKEEARGLIRWLRPDYQKARAGLTVSVQPTEAQDSMMLVVDAAREQKPQFPTGEVERTAAVMAALAHASAPVDAASIAAGFRQGKRAEPQVQATLASLARMGFASSRDGRSFMVRRVA